MFTTPVFIKKNTPELRKKLEKIGYKNYDNPFQITDNSRIYTTIDGYYVPYYVSNIDNSWIDCEENEELFLAIASLRDDTDIHQYFTDGKEWILCNEEKYDYTDSFAMVHKATVGELIQHFEK